MALSETLELDVSDALRQVDKVDEALNRSATSFGVSLAEALDVLRQPAQVTIDSADLTLQVSDAVQSADLTAPVTLEGLDAAQADLTSAIDAGVSAADTTIPVTADGLDAVTADVTEAVQVADTTVTVTADTEPAIAAVADLGVATEGASGAMEGLSGSTRGLDVAAGLAAGELGRLKEALPEESNLGGIAAGFAALAAGVAESFHEADAAEIADTRLTNTLGDLAEQVTHVDVGGLSGDLVELSQAAGSSDEPLKLSIARLAELGQSTGATDEQIVRVSQNITALALRLSVVNPTLGQAGDIAARLTTAFARGGRALAPFGLALSATEINARALADTGKTAAADLTLFDKSSAGAAIAVERLGNSLGSDFQKGTQQTVIGLRSVREEFRNALEEIGKPLLEPVLREIRAGEPALVDLASAFGEIAVAVLPLAADLIGIAGPALHSTLQAVEVLLPVVNGVVTVVEKIPAPVLAAVGVFLALRSAGHLLSPVLTGVGNAVAAMAYNAAIGESAVAGVGASLAGLVNPATLALAAIAAVVTVIGAHNAAAAKERREVRALSEELAKQTSTLDELIKTRLEDRIQTKNQTDDLIRLGLTTADVTKLVLEGRDGYEAFLAQLTRTGELTPKVGAALIQGAGAGRSLNEVLATLDSTQVDLGKSNIGLVRTFLTLQRESEKGARGTLDMQVAQGKLSKAQVDAAVAQHRLIEGGTDYQAVLDELLPMQTKLADGTIAYGTAAEQAAAETKSYADALDAIRTGTDAVAVATAKAGPGLGSVIALFLRGGLTGEQFGTVLANTGLTAEELTAALKEAQDGAEQFGDTFVANIQRVTGASADLSKDESLDAFLTDLHKKTLAEISFLDNLATLRRRDADDLAQTFEEAGLASAKQLAAAAKLGDEALAKREAQRQADVAANERALQAQRQFGIDAYAEQQRANDLIGSAKPPDLTTPILHALGFAESALQHHAHDLIDDMEGIGRNLGESIGTGLDTSQPAIFRAAERAARAAKAGFAQELQIHSPSKVFLEYGVNSGTSYVLGLDSTRTQVADAAVRLARGMALNVPGSRTTANPAAAPTAVATGRASGVRDIIVNQAGKSPEEVAFTVDAMLGAEVQR